MYRSQLPAIQKVIEDYEAAAKLLRQLPGDFNKVYTVTITKCFLSNLLIPL